MDPVTAFVIATGFALLNGAVLGFVHPSLTEELRPSAADWRIGTLLIALSGLVFAANGLSGVVWILPIANGLVFAGFALYLRSIRRYTQRPDSHWLFLPAVIGIAALMWFTYASPNIVMRIAISTFVNLGYTIAMTVALIAYRKRERSIASAFLIGLFVSVSILVALRVVYYVTVGANATSITAAGSIIASLTPLLISAAPIVGTTAFALLCFERIRNELNVAATTDALTELPNRRTINERAATMFSAARENRNDFSIAVIDIDHFKQVNDRYGHDVGDAVLQHVARILDEVTRGTHFVGRMGGEEFVALFDRADLHDATSAAERLRSAVESTPVTHSSSPIAVTVSVGVAALSAGDTTYPALLRRADRALYDAKAAGRNRVVHSPPNLTVLSKTFS